MANNNTLNQLKQNYNDGWGGTYTLYELYNLWADRGHYNNSSVNIIKCIGYYMYKHKNGYKGYWNADYEYTRSTGKWRYYVGSGNSAGSNNYGLPKGNWTMIYNHKLEGSSKPDIRDLFLNNWFSKGNKLNQDFELYSTHAVRQV